VFLINESSDDVSESRTLDRARFCAVAIVSCSVISKLW